MSTPIRQAALALGEALASTTAAPKLYWKWVGVVRGPLGVRVVRQNRWDEIIAEGEAMGLFRVENKRLISVKAPEEGEAPVVVPEVLNGNQRAAKAVAEAAEDHDGDYKKYWQWASAARPVLGVGRIANSRWQAILDEGQAMGLFVLQGKLLVPTPKIDDTPRPTKKVEVVVEEDWTPPPTPENWTPRAHLDCGHWNYQVVVKSPEECTPAELKRLAEDYRGPRPTKTIFVPSPEECLACKAGKPGDPQHQKGEYRTPVPVSQRRSAERQSRQGFQGLCCDSKGFYIGGLGNDCRHYHNGPERCAAHAH